VLAIFARAPVRSRFLSYPSVMVTGMGFSAMEKAITQLEKANADLEPEI
jgi:hypothetical protein